MRFEADANTVWLSAILDWYGDDFDAGGGIFAFLVERITDPGLKEKVEAAGRKTVKHDFNTYDWSLNAQAMPAGAAPAEGGGGFGSGSIPNR